MDKYIQQFNTTFELFVKLLIEWFPNDSDFKLLKNSYNLLILCNKTTPYTLFAKGLSDEYIKHIQSHNEEFFVNHTYDDVIKDSELATEETLFDIMNKLKNYWTQLNNEQKTLVWKHLDAFVIIHQKISSIN